MSGPAGATPPPSSPVSAVAAAPVPVAAPAAPAAASSEPSPATAMAEAPISFETLNAEKLVEALKTLGIPEDAFKNAAKVLKAVKLEEMIGEMNNSTSQAIFSLFIPFGLIIAAMNLIDPAKNLLKLEELRKGLKDYLKIVKDKLTNAAEVRPILLEELSTINSKIPANLSGPVTSMVGNPEFNKLIRLRIAELESKAVSDAASIKRGAILRAYYESSPKPLRFDNKANVKTVLEEEIVALAPNGRFTERNLNKIGKAAALFLFSRLYVSSHYQKPSARTKEAMADIHYAQVSELATSLRYLIKKPGWFSNLAIMLRTKLAESAATGAVQDTISKTTAEVTSTMNDLMAKRDELKKQSREVTSAAIKKTLPKVTMAISQVADSLIPKNTTGPAKTILDLVQKGLEALKGLNVEKLVEKVTKMA